MVGGTRAFTHKHTHTRANTFPSITTRMQSKTYTPYKQAHTHARRWGANILRTSRARARACLHPIDRAAASRRGSMKVFHSLLKLAIIIFLRCTRTHAHMHTQTHILVLGGSTSWKLVNHNIFCVAKFEYIFQQYYNNIFVPQYVQSWQHFYGPSCLGFELLTIRSWISSLGNFF